jgi:hypothetical protein
VIKDFSRASFWKKEIFIPCVLIFLFLSMSILWILRSESCRHIYVNVLTSYVDRRKGHGCQIQRKRRAWSVS